MSGTHRYRVRVDDTDHEVQVDPDALSAVVDGHAYTLSRGPDGSWVVRSANSTAHHLVWLDPAAKPRSGACGGTACSISVRSAQQAALEETLAAGSIAGLSGARITAPMPGRVVRVLADPGQTVELEQPVMIIEAMKMENELRAPSAGKVVHVAVGVGATVDAGQLLVELAPHDSGS